MGFSGSVQFGTGLRTIMKIKLLVLGTKLKIEARQKKKNNASCMVRVSDAAGVDFPNTKNPIIKRLVDCRCNNYF